MAARPGWIMALVVMTTACNDAKPEPVDFAPKPTRTTPIASGSDIAGVAMPRTTGSSAPRVAPKHATKFHRPDGPPNKGEGIYGTWVATVGNYASRSAFMADEVTFAVAPGPDAITAIADAITKDTELSTNCIWVELNQDFTGIRRECAVVNGEASALDQNDLATGAKKDFGTTLHWYFDLDAKLIRIHFDADMIVPRANAGQLESLVFRDWAWKIGKPAGDNKYEIIESFPEHDFELPTHYVYEIAPHSFIGKP